MGELLDFAAKLLKCQAAELERPLSASRPTLEAILPQPLAARLGLSEFVTLVEGAAATEAVRLAYGTELLERMIALATEEVPLSQATIPEPLKPATNAVEAALARFSGLNCVLRPSAEAPCEGWASYLLVDFRYLADADERQEGLIRIGLNEQSRALIDYLPELVPHATLLPGQSEGAVADALSSSQAEMLLKQASRAARQATLRALEPMQRAVKRRHLRDRGRLRSYFAALQQEMEKQLERLERRKGSGEEQGSRKKKIEELPLELERKLCDLAARYVLRVEVKPIAALRLTMRARRVVLSVKRRQAQRELLLHQSALGRTFDPLACECCGQSTYGFALCDSKLHVLCPSCDGARSSAKSCPVCSGARPAAAGRAKG
jgi:hypothetical protein